MELLFCHIHNAFSATPQSSNVYLTAMAFPPFSPSRYFTQDSYHLKGDPERFTFLNALGVVFMAFLQLEYPLQKESAAGK